ncbi:hypothetical protein J437_LFUL010649 [Ladona fulva]|uniref:PiggyBac transposable element-derived protein domain-containing protein n=1 Tax=Ladona fulva TaxID=123851 RepID=A0A8K0KPU9_LADFU|nr:hypothetical protein J437_LFUL010649 [Ladona fulva]
MSDSTPLEVFLLFFEVIISLLVQETNRYYLHFLAKQDEGPSPQIDVTFSEMMTFLAIVIQMGHDIRDTLKDYWSQLEQFYTAFFGNTMLHDRPSEHLAIDKIVVLFKGIVVFKQYIPKKLSIRDSAYKYTKFVIHMAIH